MAAAALIATMSAINPDILKEFAAQDVRDDRTKPDPERLSKAEKKRARKAAHRIKCQRATDQSKGEQP
jgi:hypothetical protein